MLTYKEIARRNAATPLAVMYKSCHCSSRAYPKMAAQGAFISFVLLPIVYLSE